MGEPCYVFLQRDNVALAKLLPHDAAWLTVWLNDQTTTRWMATGRVPVQPQLVAAQIEQWQPPNNWAFTILREQPKEIGYEGPPQFDPMGYVGLWDVDLITRKAEFRILLGQPFVGHGYGTKATQLALDFGFGMLNLHRIWLGVTDANIGAVKVYERCGFTREGVLRDDLYRNGQFYDSIRMSIIETEWRKTCLTEEVKPVETSEPGLVTPSPAGEPWIGFWPPGVA
jgi:RimJ/RimL family protein N-acetyltransferase